jgi:hypothetical protein
MLSTIVEYGMQLIRPISENIKKGYVPNDISQKQGEYKNYQNTVIIWNGRATVRSSSVLWVEPQFQIMYMYLKHKYLS